MNREELRREANQRRMKLLSLSEEELHRLKLRALNLRDAVKDYFSDQCENPDALWNSLRSFDQPSEGDANGP